MKTTTTKNKSKWSIKVFKKKGTAEQINTDLYFEGKFVASVMFPEYISGTIRQEAQWSIIFIDAVEIGNETEELPFN